MQRTTDPRQPTIDRDPPGSHRYGAPMGRPDWIAPPAGPVRLFRVQLDRGGYDRGGHYWGTAGTTAGHVYCATDADQFRMFVRAWDRPAAIAELARRCAVLGQPVPTLARQ